jgi:threonyl-tRNA synthetase
LNKKIREAELAKIPCILVCGEREAKAGAVSVRRRHVKEQSTITVEDFIQTIISQAAEHR